MDSIVAHADLAVPRPTFAPPLDVAREQARRVLGEANALDLDVTNPFVLGVHFGDLCEVLREVLAALDAEDGRHAA